MLFWMSLSHNLHEYIFIIFILGRYSTVSSISQEVNAYEADEYCVEKYWRVAMLQVKN